MSSKRWNDAVFKGKMQLMHLMWPFAIFLSPIYRPGGVIQAHQLHRGRGIVGTTPFRPSDVNHIPREVKRMTAPLTASGAPDGDRTASPWNRPPKGGSRTDIPIRDVFPTTAKKGIASSKSPVDGARRGRFIRIRGDRKTRGKTTTTTMRLFV